MSPAAAQPVRVELGRLCPRDLARVPDIAAVLGRQGLVVVARRGTTIVVRPGPVGGQALAVAQLRRPRPDVREARQLVASSPSLFPPRPSEERRHGRTRSAMATART